MASINAINNKVANGNFSVPNGRGDFANGVSFDSGTNTLSTYTATTTWTPTLLFGGANVGMTTSVAIGTYTRLGTLGMFSVQMVLTAKGSSTGAATITGLPIAPNGSCGAAFSVRFSNLTFTGQVVARNAASSATINIDEFTSGGAVAALTDTAFANNTILLITGCFPI